VNLHVFLIFFLQIHVLTSVFRRSDITDEGPWMKKDS